MKTAHKLAGQYNFSNLSDVDRISAALFLASAAFSNAMYLASHPAGEKQLRVSLPGLAEPIVRRSTGAVSTVHASTWITACCLALATRDLDHLDAVLMRTGQDTLRASSTVSAPFRLAQVEALQAAYQRLPDTAEKLEVAMDAMRTDRTDSIDRAFVVDIAVHETGMLGMLLLGDGAGFNAEVGAALKSHKRYHDRNGTAYQPDNHVRSDPRFWICLPALGLASWASRTGMQVSVESDHLPLEPRRSGTAAY